MQYLLPPTHKAQQGVVIVVALFIVALVATLSFIMVVRLERDTQRTALLLRNTQAEFYAQGAINWGIAQLAINLEKQQQDKIVDTFPMVSPVREMNGYQVSTKVYDMQSRFNLNILNEKSAQESFIKLFQWANPKISVQDAQAIIRAIADWVDFQSKSTEFNKFYLESTPSYQVAHRPMLSPSELMYVKGITPEIYAALQPYVTALPGGTQINIQTASAPVLLTLAPNVNIDHAKALAELRDKTPIVSMEKFSELEIVKNNQIPSEKVTLISKYFLIEAKVTIEKQSLVLYTLVERTLDEKEKKVIIRIVWQSKGIW